MRVHEQFRSIQGEGLLIGAPTHFVRTSGCNLSCAWCDTRYASESWEELSPERIMGDIGGFRTVCLTGGEPLLQEDAPELLSLLRGSGKAVVLETSGAMPLDGIPNWGGLVISMDVKCPSSGMSGRMLASNMRILSGKDQVKFVIGDGGDLDYAERFLRDNPTAATPILSPVGGMDLAPLAEEALSRGMDARVLPQLHKIIWGDRRGV